ncbi:MAG: ice-binding family protein, partial [Gemmatimonadaceae bacterium]|nr:ice-binding family protein [Gemmatimonadaceae bacterium]
MNRLEKDSKHGMGWWALLLVAFVAGCGDSSSPVEVLSPIAPAADLASNTAGVGQSSDGVSALGQRPVELGAADTYVILAKSKISNVPTSAITGNIGLSPAAASYITGFALRLPAGGTFSKSSQVTGNVYAADYAVPTPA